MVGQAATVAMPEKSQGSSLGGCMYMSKDSATVGIYARPAAEWDETKKSYRGSPVVGGRQGGLRPEPFRGRGQDSAGTVRSITRVSG